MPSSHTATDECMVRATERFQDTYKMPSRPIQQGFKFHCLADQGYIWDFHPTSNQAGPDPIPPIDGVKNKCRAEREMRRLIEVMEGQEGNRVGSVIEG